MSFWQLATPITLSVDASTWKVFTYGKRKFDLHLSAILNFLCDLWHHTLRRHHHCTFYLSGWRHTSAVPRVVNWWCHWLRRTSRHFNSSDTDELPMFDNMVLGTTAVVVIPSLTRVAENQELAFHFQSFHRLAGSSLTTFIQKGWLVLYSTDALTNNQVQLHITDASGEPPLIFRRAGSATIRRYNHDNLVILSHDRCNVQSTAASPDRLIR